MKSKAKIERLEAKIVKLKSKIESKQRKYKTADRKIAKAKKNDYILQFITIEQIDEFVQMSKESNSPRKFHDIFSEAWEYHPCNKNGKYYNDIPYTSSKHDLYMLPDAIDTYACANYEIEELEADIKKVEYEIQKIFLNEKEFWDSIPSIVLEFVDYWGTKCAEWYRQNTDYDADRIARIISDDREAKCRNFMLQVKHKVGEIEDVSLLTVCEKGLLNGVVKGSRANATISTISAGGYNIQCFHYRTLVKVFERKNK